MRADAGTDGSDCPADGNPPAHPPSFISRQVTDALRFYLNLDPRTRRELTIVCGGWEECAQDYVVDRRTFPYYSIELVVSGRGEVELGNQRHELAPGVVFTYGPDIPHAMRSSRTERLRKYFVDFTGRGARKFLNQFNLVPGEVLRIGLLTEARQAFDALINSALSHDRFAEKAARLQLELLLIWIARGARANVGSSRRAAAVFDRCRQYFIAHFRTIRTVQDAALACHINVAYLTRLFRRFQDETPYRYLQRLQVQWAAERLQSTDCLVKSIASEFNIDQFQFSRAFKRVYGISPSAFIAQRRAASIPPARTAIRL
ncbi:AraC family transcriptional regulator [Opitutus terrae]|uniref:Transcriptional regulator, AraC family n=1 Tax=Opitutus terrae (strain DSM 11246 / JCM 15787 / PB90-1) TaxID=452637 RepID=B1ZN32_OPITP|nr:AraC family transcriptional regulator [Opitutus terrae]ACB76484.1 transcriptional regulator, AraC family [Opitutus terrae PB90-1]